MIQGAWSTVKKGHTAASRWAGKFGSEAGLDGVRLPTGEPSLARMDALTARGSKRMKIGYGTVGGIGVVNRMRSPGSSGRDGLQPHSTGGATMGDPSMMY